MGGGRIPLGGGEGGRQGATTMGVALRVHVEGPVCIQNKSPTDLFQNAAVLQESDSLDLETRNIRAHADIGNRTGTR